MVKERERKKKDRSKEKERERESDLFLNMLKRIRITKDETSL